MPHAQRATDTILTLLKEGRLIRGAWAGRNDDGRKTACLLAALSPETAGRKDAAGCPAKIMPAWLAHLTPWMNDKGTETAWPGMVKRYADLAGRWHVLTTEDWRRLCYAARRIMVEIAMPHAMSGTASVRAARDLLAIAESGGKVVIAEWQAAAQEAMKNQGSEASAETARSALWAEVQPRGIVIAATWAAQESGMAKAADLITALILDAIESAICTRSSQNLQ